MKPINTRGVMVVLVVMVVLAAFACSALPTEEPPGVGEKAERGYAACSLIIHALEQYHSEKGEYPESLAELTPDYLAAIPTEVNNEPISYMKTEESFSLSFYYIGPGMNICTFTPEEQWQCSGAY